MSDWRRIPLGELVDVVKDKIEPSDAAGLPYIGLEHIQKGTSALVGQGTPDQVNSTKGRFRRGDVLYGKLRPYLNKVHLAQSDGVASTDILILRARAQVSAKFILYRLLSPDFVNYASERTNGVNLPRVSPKTVWEFSVSVPALDEQERIVNRIEALLSDVDSATATLAECVALLTAHKQSVLYDTFCGHTGDGCYTRSLPSGWRWATVGEVATLAGGQTPKGLDDRCHEVGDIPFFRVGDMNRPENLDVMTGGANWLTADAARGLGIHVRPVGTIVFPKRGGAIATNKKRVLGRPAAYDMNTMGVIPANVNPQFLRAWFESLDLGSIADGSNIPQINNKDVQPLRLPLPPADIQASIVSRVEDAISLNKHASDTVRVESKHADALKQSILVAAFCGELN